ncbi:Nuclear pore complex protein Nup98-Nup96 [Massospora cicadina]|nr:Nuclear pore complex protein Nup98-Nup96 [Massospora cicadina]
MPSYAHEPRLALGLAELGVPPIRRLELEPTRVVDLTGLISDAGFALGRSFRAGWGPRGNLYFVGRNGKTLCDVHVGGGFGTTTMVSLEAVRGRHVITLSGYLSEMALIDPPGGTQDRLAQAEFGTHSWESLSKVVGAHPQPFEPFELHLWKLLPILFGPTTASDGAARGTTLQQKQQLERWLSEVIQSGVYQKHRPANSRSTHALDEVVQLLKRFRVREAVTGAIRRKYPRLAILISQAGGDPCFKHFVLNQLCDWVDGRTIVSIDPHIVQIYFLLAGIVYPTIHARTCPEALSNLATCVDALTAGASWLEAFALAFWYATFYDQPIATALAEYDAAGSVARPYAWYVPDSGPTDVVYHLLKLQLDPTYPLAKVLDPRGSCACPLNFRVSWFIANLLHTLRAGVPDLPGCFEALTHQYVFQLASAGLWEWGVLVAMHLKAPDARASAVKELVGRHMELVAPEIYSKYPAQALGPELFTKKDLFLIRRLGVAESWLHTAKAWRAQYLGATRAQMLHLLLANDLYSAHEVFLYKLAPNLVFGNLPQLHDVAAHLALHRLPGWSAVGECRVDSAWRPRKAPPQKFLGLDPGVVPRAHKLLKLLNSRPLPSILAIGPSLAHLNSYSRMALMEMVSTLACAIAQASHPSLSRLSGVEGEGPSNVSLESPMNSNQTLAQLHLSPALAAPTDLNGPAAPYGHPEALRHTVHHLANAQF